LVTVNVCVPIRGSDRFESRLNPNCGEIPEFPLDCHSLIQAPRIVNKIMPMLMPDDAVTGEMEYWDVQCPEQIDEGVDIASNLNLTLVSSILRTM
jgi:hypothetical protein